MISRRFSTVTLPLFFFVVCFAAPLCHADWPPVSKEELDFKNVPSVPDAPAVVLFHEEIDDDTIHYHQVYYRIKILTEAGRKYADVQVPYDRHGSNVGSVKARTTHADGTVANFEGKPLDKEVERYAGYKVHVKTVTLPDVQVGSVIEYQYSWRYDDNLVVSPKWDLQGDLYERKAHYKFTPTQHEVVNERDIISNGLAWVSNLPKGAEIKSFHDKYYELTLNDVPPFFEEDHMPPPQTFKYHVAFYYRWAVQADAFWKDEGKYWNKQAEKFLSKNAGLREALATIIQPSDSSDQKARKIYAFVQTLDNTSYMPRQSEEELKTIGLKPNLGVEDVLRQKRGSRNQITRLFVALCREAGVPAYLMWVTDRGENLFTPLYLTTEQLDEEIAFVTIDGKEVPVDPGTKFAPYAVINWRYSASKGLKQMAGGKADLADSPMPTHGGDAIQRVGSFRLSDEGEAQGTLLVRFYGQEALWRRLEGARTDDAGRKKMLEDEIREWLPSNSEVTVIKDATWMDYEKPLAVEFKVSAPILSRAGKRVLMPTDFFVVNRPAKFAHKDRLHIVYFHFPPREVDNITVVLPPSLEVESMPTPSMNQLPYAVYSSKPTQQGNTITTLRNMEVGGLVFPVPEYPTLKGFFDKMKTGDDQQVVLRSAGHAGN
jgi:transglutaminase-like putative cysteine protease